MSRKLFGVLLVLVTLGFRFLPHPANFRPLLAIFIFSSGYFRNKMWAVAFPFIIMFLSDLLVNNIMYSSYFDGFVIFYQGALWTYLAIVSISLLALVVLKNFNFKNTVLMSLIASVMFFLVSNFGVWFNGTMYPHTLQGLVECYTMGIPFFKNTLLSTLLFASVMYGITFYVERKLMLNTNN